MRNEILCSSCGTANSPGNAVCGNCQNRLVGIPRWAQGSGVAIRASNRRWAARIAVGLILAVLVWFNYPYVPNPVVWLFRSPSSDLSSRSSSEFWSMRGANPDGSGYVAESSHVLQGTLERSLDLGGSTRSSPAIVNGVVYIGGGFKVIAIDEASGETRWETQTTGPVHGTPAVAGDNLFVALQDKRLWALDLKSGAVRWEFKSDSPFVGSAVVDGGIVYAGAQDGRIYAVDAISGSRIWKLDVGSSVVQPPAVYQGKVVVGSSAGNIFVQSAKTGDKRLRIRTGSLLVRRPVTGNGQIYLLSKGDSGVAQSISTKSDLGTTLDLATADSVSAGSTGIRLASDLARWFGRLPSFTGGNPRGAVSGKRHGRYLRFGPAPRGYLVAVPRDRSDVVATDRHRTKPIFRHLRWHDLRSRPPQRPGRVADHAGGAFVGAAEFCVR